MWTRDISFYNNIIKEEYDESENHHISIKLKKQYSFSRFGCKICLLNGNRFCIYGDKDNKIDVYIIK